MFVVFLNKLVNLFLTHPKEERGGAIIYSLYMLTLSWEKNQFYTRQIWCKDPWFYNLSLKNSRIIVPRPSLSFFFWYSNLFGDGCRQNGISFVGMVRAFCDVNLAKTLFWFEMSRSAASRLESLECVFCSELVLFMYFGDLLRLIKMTESRWPNKKTVNVTREDCKRYK